MKEWQKFPVIFLILLIAQSLIFLALGDLSILKASVIPFILFFAAVSLVAGLAIYLMISSAKRTTKIALGAGLLIILWLIVYLIYLWLS